MCGEPPNFTARGPPSRQTSNTSLGQHHHPPHPSHHLHHHHHHSAMSASYGAGLNLSGGSVAGLAAGSPAGAPRPPLPPPYLPPPPPGGSTASLLAASAGGLHGHVMLPNGTKQVQAMITKFVSVDLTMISEYCFRVSPLCLWCLYSAKLCHQYNILSTLT